MLQRLNSVYVVEDEANARNMMVDFLSQFKSVQTKGFPTGDACIKEIVSGGGPNPELILIDYYLDVVGSKYDGLDTLSKVVEICPGSKVIMFTSVDNNRIRQLAAGKGAFAYIVKGDAGFEKLKEVIEENFSLS